MNTSNADAFVYYSKLEAGHVFFSSFLIGCLSAWGRACAGALVQEEGWMDGWMACQSKRQHEG